MATQPLGDDVDLLVEMETGATLFDVIGLEQDLADMLRRSVDVLTESSDTALMRDDARRTAVRL